MTTILLAVLLLALVLASWAATVLGMPGNWLILMLTAAYAYFGPVDSRAAIGWQVLAALLIMAGLGEIVVLLMASAGATRAGASRRGAVLALCGSLIGGVVGVFVGLPIPLLGPLLAALFFAGLGAAVGVIVGELSAGKDLNSTWRISKAAFWGRLAGTAGKMIVGTIMVAVVAAALIL